MNDNNNNNNNSIYGIDKFEGSFDKEELGVTIIPNTSINDIRNLDSLGLYIYLLARPPGWKLNVKQLKEHFECGKEKIYKNLKWLLSNGFITCSVPRTKGRFDKPHYRVHLNPKKPVDLVDLVASQPVVDLVDLVDLNRENPYVMGVSPYPEKPDAVKRDTYKTYNITNKDLKTPYVDSANTTKEINKSTTKFHEYKDNSLFMKFYGVYPNKQKPILAYKAFLKHKPTELFVMMLVDDIIKRIDNNWKGRHKNKIPFPATYLNSREWEGEIYTNIESTTRKSMKYKTMDEIIGDCL
jgi:hypothetical protein